MSGCEPITNPLPQRYLLGEEGVGGSLKERPEDFVVEEMPAYEPCGEGEHLYLRIEKTGVSHGELISCLSRHFGLTSKAIGYAGMKDKIGVTRQTVSLHLLSEPPPLELPHERIKVLWAKRHRNKIRRGHLLGNRFLIRIRNIDPDRKDSVLQRLQKLERLGAPDYFGPQRFGYRANNQLLGAAYLCEDWRRLLTELLGTKGSWFPQYQQERRELFDAGRIEEAAVLWTMADRAELIAIRALRDGRCEREACTAVGRPTLSFWVTAAVSAIFNKVVDQRIADETIDLLLEGDLAFKHDSRAVFPVTEDELATGELPARLASLEISPSGPLWGKDMTRARGRVAEIEEAAAETIGLPVQLLTDPARGPDGGRRPLRSPLRNIAVDSGTDEHGPFVQAAFELPRGAYATVVMREVMKVEEAALTGFHRE
ncbi:MAG: tRNA pseudouridine(13) synthase TruD [Phycisphaerales bacterium]|nr:MAG: tRNA pseudouridine(13) synthase TruD [Phycisphaerales bacterium]